MRPFLFALLFLLPPAVIAQAEERSLLDQLQAETRKLAGSAAGAVVEVTARGSKQPSIGILVGSPARLVVPAGANPPGAVMVTLHASSKAQATLIATSADLGIAVYSLPGELKGIEPVGDWKDLRPGTLGLEVPPEARTTYRLRILSGANPVLGRLESGDDASPGLLIGTHGRLIVLRGTPLRTTVQTTYRTTVQTTFAGRVNMHPLGNPLSVLMPPDRRGLTILPLRSPDVLFRVIGPAGTSVHRLDPRTGRRQDKEVVTLPGPVIARVLQDLDQAGRIRQA